MTHVLLASALLCPVAAMAQSTRPESLLQKLGDELATVSTHSRQSIIYVQLPTPQWVLQAFADESPLSAWRDQMSPSMRQWIREGMGDPASKAGPVTLALSTTLPSATQPATAPAATQPTEVGLTPELLSVLSRSGILQVTGSGMGFEFVVPRSIAVVIDDAGLAVLPLYIDPKLQGDRPLRAYTSYGDPVSATLVAADKQTGLSLLRLDRTTTTSATLASDSPRDGALTMLLPIDGGEQRLVLWSSAESQRDLVVDAAGNFVGFARGGRLFLMRDAVDIAKELAKTGKVDRATLGVWVREVGRDDPLRHETALLSSRPAMAVVQLSNDTPAARAGLQAGDLIVSVGDQAVGDLPAFAMALRKYKQGPVQLMVLRGDVEMLIKVDVTPPPR